MMKIYYTTTLILIFSIQPFFSKACEVCKDNQPAALKNITHGTGPQGISDYCIIIFSGIIVVVTLVMCIKYMIRPNENQVDHIKNIVIN